METIQQLQGRAVANARAARNLLAEMGGRPSAAMQAAFDALMDETERTEALLQLRQSTGESAIATWALQREGFSNFLSGALPSAHEAKRIHGAMSTTTPAEGGYSVGTLVAADIVDLLKGYGWMRQVAGQVTTASGADMGYPTSDGSAEAGEMVAQNATATSADETFNTRGLNVYKFSSKVFAVPIELLQDSAIDLVAQITNRAVDRIGRVQNQKFTIGTGTGEPTGLVTAASVGKTGATGQTLTIIYDDLVDVADSLDEAQLGMPSKQRGMPQAKVGWMFSQTMRKVIRKLKDSNGRPIWTPAVGRDLPQLLDYPVYINNDMPVPAANAKSLAFGNLGSYMIRDALQVIMFRLTDSAYARNGQVGFLAWARAGGNLLDLGAVKLYQHPAT